MKNIITRIVTTIAVLVVLTATAAGQMRTNKFGVGVSGSYFLLQADFTSKLSIGGGVDMSYSLMENFSLRSSLGLGLLEAKSGTLPSAQTTLIFGNLYLTADLSPNGEFNPFIFVGGSGIYFDARTGTGTLRTDGVTSKRLKGTVVGGVGFDYFVSEFVSFTVAGEMALPYTDRLDGFINGTKKDSYQRISLGIKYYFFDQEFLTRMLKALEERYK